MLMSNRSFFDKSDADIYTGTQNFVNLLQAPGAPDYGPTPAQITAYNVLSVNYRQAYETAIEPTTRTKVAVEAKNIARAALRASARNLASLIDGTPTVTDDQKIALGIHVRDTNPTPTPVPDSAPQLAIVNTTGNVIQVRLSSIEVGKRGKPSKVRGATVYTFVGENPPVDNVGWQFFGNSGRVNFEIEFSANLPAGTTVWITAGWYNPRGALGPLCAPVKAMLLGGVEASNTGGLKIAA